MKKINFLFFVVFIMGILLGWKFPSFINPAVPYEKERKIGKPPPDLDDKMLDKIGNFLAMDIASLPDGDPKKKTMTPNFYVIYSHPSKIESEFELIPKTEKDNKLLEESGLVKGKYCAFAIINEISDLGVTMRFIAISHDGKIFWEEGLYSLLHYQPKAEMGRMVGGISIFDLDSADISEIFSSAQMGKILIDYKPSSKELEEYKRRIFSLESYFMCCSESNPQGE